MGHQGVNVNGAVVVMDVRTGDVLALVSSPAFDPNDFAQGISHEKYQRIQDLSAEKNRATFENYAPGSIFKTVVALAALENGLNPAEIYHVQADSSRPGKGCIWVGRRKIEDTVEIHANTIRHRAIANRADDAHALFRATSNRRRTTIRDANNHPPQRNF